MKICHLVHGLYGKNNGIDVYLRNFVEASPDDNFIIVPREANIDSQDFGNKVLEIDSLEEVPQILQYLNADIFIIHWAGIRSFKNNDDLVNFRGKIISLSGRSLEEVIQIDNHPYGFLKTAELGGNNGPVIIISHCCTKIPDCYYFADSIVHVSTKAYAVNSHLETEHAIIYPCSKLPVFDPVPSTKIRIGWLGNLQKYDNQVYQFIKETYGNNDNLEFIFAGAGELDREPPQNFKFTGVIEPKDFFENVDIFLYPTKIDSFSIATLEAILQGLPCIVSGQVSDLINLTNHFNCSTYFDLEHLKERLDHLIKFPSLRQRSKIKWFPEDRFSPESMTEKFQELFKLGSKVS